LKMRDLGQPYFGGIVLAVAFAIFVGIRKARSVIRFALKPVRQTYVAKRVTV